jgi:hypothetical protein
MSVTAALKKDAGVNALTVDTRLANLDLHGSISTFCFSSPCAAELIPIVYFVKKGTGKKSRFRDSNPNS